MSRVYVYARVSTEGQTTDNQVEEVRTAGFAVEPKRVVVETISGSTCAMERPGFAALVEHKLEAGDVLVVTKLDRLGRNAADVRATVQSLAAEGVKVHCLALGGMDLTSASGKLTMGVISNVAEFELDLLRERTQSGLARAKREGKTLGRPALFTASQRADIAQRRSAGMSLGKLAAEFGVTRSAIQRAVKAGS